MADAITFPWKSILTFGIDKVVKYHADLRLYQATFVWVMNKSWYGKLSTDQKKVIDDHCTNVWAQKMGVEWGNDEDVGQGAAVEGRAHHRQAHVGSSWMRGRRRPRRSTTSGSPMPTRPATTARRCWRSCAAS